MVTRFVSNNKLITGSHLDFDIENDGIIDGLFGVVTRGSKMARRPISSKPFKPSASGSIPAVHVLPSMTPDAWDLAEIPSCAIAYT